MTDTDELPNRLREWRTARGMKLEEVADRLNCSIPQVSYLERGRTRLTEHWLKRFAAIYNVGPADLIHSDEAGSQLTPEEMQLIEQFRRGTAEQRAQIVSMANILIPPEKGGNVRRLAG